MGVRDKHMRVCDKHMRVRNKPNGVSLILRKRHVMWYVAHKTCHILKINFVKGEWSYCLIRFGLLGCCIPEVGNSSFRQHVQDWRTCNVFECLSYRRVVVKVNDTFDSKWNRYFCKHVCFYFVVCAVCNYSAKVQTKTSASSWQLAFQLTLCLGAWLASFTIVFLDQQNGRLYFLTCLAALLLIKYWKVSCFLHD